MLLLLLLLLSALYLGYVSLHPVTRGVCLYLCLYLSEGLCEVYLSHDHLCFDIGEHGSEMFTWLAHFDEYP